LGFGFWVQVSRLSVYSFKGFGCEAQRLLHVSRVQDHPPAVIAHGGVGSVEGAALYPTLVWWNDDEGVVTAEVMLVGHAHPIISRLARHHEVAIVIVAAAAAAKAVVIIVEHNNLVDFLATLGFRVTSLRL